MVWLAHSHMQKKKYRQSECLRAVVFVALSYGLLSNILYGLAQCSWSNFSGFIESALSNYKIKRTRPDFETLDLDRTKWMNESSFKYVFQTPWTERGKNHLNHCCLPAMFSWTIPNPWANNCLASWGNKIVNNDSCIHVQFSHWQIFKVARF